jgi:hypothetical protein
VKTAVCAGMMLLASNGVADEAPESASVSGIYPALAMFNQEAECGTGAVVPWAGRLWAVTYAPHKPAGSTDKLYEITPDLRQLVRPESIGGTPANRMLHRESQQLFIGPYAIDATGGVRAIPYTSMFGRPTGNARHLTDPAGKIYCATMEEGVYEVDVKTLAVTELWADEQRKAGRHADLPGYHGKGFYAAQGRLVYANNGDHAAEARSNPAAPSGCLAEWDGRADHWTIVRRNQFTEVTGPGGIEGNANPDAPLWSIGWDHRSLILMVLDKRAWHAYRLPKASHCYDGAHGWNTEWPRIRDIGERDLLMTMHGMFWRFPRDLRADRSAGIAPRATYLKVIGDFCRWNDRLVFGCDDTAKSEFLNKRKVKGGIAGPGQSQSNLWFVEPGRLDRLGPALGRGAVWMDEEVRGGTPSEPFLFAGFDQRTLFLAHRDAAPVRFALEVDRDGRGAWRPLREIEVAAGGCEWLEFPAGETGAWIRVTAARDCAGATAFFHYRNADARASEAGRIFDGLARPGDSAVCGGLVYARGEDLRTLAFAAVKSGADGVADAGYYELDGDLKLARKDDLAARAALVKNVAIPAGVITVDAASVLVVDDAGRRWRLPKGDAAFDAAGPLGPGRVCREVCTERDLFNAAGTFFELPAENAGGYPKIRPIATHNRRIHDYCSYRGLLILTGVADNAPASEHIVKSDHGRVAVWVGAVDDLWDFGKPRGTGGPWHKSSVKAGQPSDPYLMTGYDRKSLHLAHDGAEAVEMTVEVDVSGTGLWIPWKKLSVPAIDGREEVFPDAFQAYWVRVTASADCRATAQFEYR